MADSPLRRLLDASSLGTPDARLLSALTPDNTARRIVERSEQIRDAIDAATPCFAPDISHYSKQLTALTGNPVRAIRSSAPALERCTLWYCPTSGEIECGTHGGFDVCCARPDLHQPTTSRCG